MSNRESTLLTALLPALLLTACTGTTIAEFEGGRIGLSSSEGTLFLGTSDCANDYLGDCRFELWAERDETLERVYQTEGAAESAIEVSALHAVSGVEAYFLLWPRAGTSAESPRIGRYRDGVVTYLETTVAPLGLVGNGAHLYFTGRDSTTDERVLMRVDGERLVELHRQPAGEGYQLVGIVSVLADGNVTWRSADDAWDEFDPDGAIVVAGGARTYVRVPIAGGDLAVTAAGGVARFAPDQVLTVRSSSGTIVYEAPVQDGFIGLFDGGSIDGFDYAVVQSRVTGTSWGGMAEYEDFYCLRRFAAGSTSDLGCFEKGQARGAIVQGSDLVYAESAWSRTEVHRHTL